MNPNSNPNTKSESKYEKLTNEHEQVRPLKLIKSGMQEITCVEGVVLMIF